MCCGSCNNDADDEVHRKLIAEIILGVTFLIFLAFKIFDSVHESLESDLIISIREISRSIKQNNSLETAVMAASHSPTSAAKYYKRIMHKSQEGLSFIQAIEFVANKSHSKMFRLICSLLTVSAKSKKDVSTTLDDFSRKVDSMKQLQDDFRTKMAASLTMLKIVVVVVFPLLYIYSTTIFGFPLDNYAFLFLGFCTLMIGFMDLIMFNDVNSSLFFFPFALSAFYVVYVKLAPVLVTFINSTIGTL